MKSLSRCDKCLQLDPQCNLKCCHSKFLGAAEHLAAVPLQQARDAARDVVDCSAELSVACTTMGKLCTGLRKVAKDACTATAATTPQLPAAQRAPIARAAAALVNTAAASAALAVTRISTAVQCVRVEAAAAALISRTLLSVAAAAASTDAAIIAAFVAVAVAGQDISAGHASLQLSAQSTAASAVAVASAGTAHAAVCAQLSVQAASHTRVLAREMQVLCSTLRAHCVAARSAAALAPSSWARDLRTILKPPITTALAPERLSFAREYLGITHSLGRLPIEDSSDTQVKNALKGWFLANDVHPDNLDTATEAALRAQLGVRFLTIEDRDSWVREHLPRQVLDLTAVEDMRTLLRAVLRFAYELEHCVQRRFATAESYVERDGKARRYAYFRDIEMFVLCILHAEMRVGEKLLTLLLTELRLREDLTVSVKQQRWRQVQIRINLLLGGEVGTQPTYEGELPQDLVEGEDDDIWEDVMVADRVEHERDGDGDGEWGDGDAEVTEGGEEGTEGGPDTQPLTDAERESQLSQEYFDAEYNGWDDADPEGLRPDAVGEQAFRIQDYSCKNLKVKMDCSDQRKLWRGFDELLAICFPAADGEQVHLRGLECAAVGGQYCYVFEMLNKQGDMTAAEVDYLQLEIDWFAKLYVEFFSRNDITNYVHCMQAGHFGYFLHRYGSLYKLQNIGLESLVKVMRSFTTRGTQGGGHCGNKKLKPWVYMLDQNAYLDAFFDKGAVIYKAGHR
ncbi:hypothetical protein B484DRAFT_403860 [Ochromonadaceae sp. CCMP2298]|nr:hypothetical protein B484DRAFT_403860 [Ochromonadaceae sp. CCMP2298]